MAQDRGESIRETINYGGFIHQFNRYQKSIYQLARIYIYIYIYIYILCVSYRLVSHTI